MEENKRKKKDKNRSTYTLKVLIWCNCLIFPVAASLIISIVPSTLCFLCAVYDNNYKPIKNKLIK